MTTLVFKDVTGAECARRLALPPGRRKVSTIARRHVRRDVPHIISIHKPWTPLAPCDETVLFRSSKKAASRSYDKVLPADDDILVVTYLPRGGRGGQSALKIAASVASLALMFTMPGLPWMGATGLPSLLGSSALSVLRTTSALVIAGVAIASVFQRPRSNTPIYGVTGGGNTPRPNSPIPVGYGQCWRVPDLSQPDYSRFENREDTILFKRAVIGQGKYKLKAIRVGTTTFWSGDISPNGGVITSGITSPFPNCKFEFIYGEASTLVPSNVITSPNVTGQNIPLSNEPNPIVGPFPTNPVGTTVNRLQVDYSTPGGYSRNGHETTQDLWFEYAPIDNAGTPTGAWQTLYRTTAAFFSDKHLRFSHTITVPEGRYAVRVQNNRAKIDDGDNCNYSWDGLRGYEPDVVVREGITEIAMEVRSSKSLGSTSFADVQVEVERVGPVWNGAAFVEGTIRKCLDCYVDILTDEVYGIGEDPALIDLAKVHTYKTFVSEFDTFDGFINGPVSAWEACNTVLLPMRSEPTRLGNGYSFTRDEPTSLRRHVFTRRQIVKGSTTVKYKPQADDGSAHFVIKFDDGGDYRRPNNAEAYYGSSSRTPTTMRVEGISSYEHAMHIARWLGAASFYRRKTVSITTELDGRLVKRGDAVGVDVWFVNATMVAGIRSFSGTTLELDVDTPIAAGHHAILRDRKGKEWGPVAVTQGATLRHVVLDPTACALEEADTGLSLAAVIGNGRGDRCSVRIGLPARLGEQFLVRAITPQTKSRVSIEALVDSAQVYTEIDAEIPPDSPLTWGLLPVEAPEILSFTAGAYQHTASIMVRWSISAQAGAARYQVEICYGNDEGPWEALSEGASPVGSAPLRYLETGVYVYVRARAFGQTGVPGSWAIAQPFVAPKPIIIATGADDGAIALAALNAQIQKILDQVRTRAENTIRKELEDLRDEFERLAEAKVSTDASTLDQIEVLKVGNESGFAAIGDTKRALIEGDLALAEVQTALAVQLADVETGLTGQGAALASLSTTVDAQGDQITVISEDVVALSADLVSVAGQAAAASSAVSSLSSTVSSQGGQISSLSSSVTGLSSTVSGLNSTVSGQATAITTLQTSVTSIDGTLSSYASQFTEVNSQIGNLSASGSFKMVAATSPPLGAFAGIELMVKSSSGGAFAYAGFEAYATPAGGGYVVLRGDRIYRRPSAGGTPVLMVDADGRFVGDAIGSGQVTGFYEFTRSEPGTDGAVGTGTTAGTAGNSPISSEYLGQLVIPANPGTISGGAPDSSYGALAVFINAMARNGPFGWGLGSAYPMTVAFRLRIDHSLGGSFYSEEGIIACSSGWTGSVAAYGFGGNPGTLSDIMAAPAGTYNVYLQYRFGPRTADGIAANPSAPSGLPLRISAKIVALVLKR